ncbi:MAG: hypothetical protein JSS66_17620 [Armatimonadetes bacterium]|nr:hypothetical protein [Armatimonadota bacterium]
MLKRILPLALVAATLVGCGGDSVLGTNSDMVVRLIRTDGTQDLMQYELYITKSADTTLNTADSEDYASTQNAPTWCDNWSGARSSTELRLGFTTRGGQTPYYVWVRVPNTGAQFETLKLQVDVDGVAGNQSTFDLNINDTQRLTGVRIDRNDATY